jgi:anti-sigma regulatory factor (Ser/Thr protein kinase)
VSQDAFLANLIMDRHFHHDAFFYLDERGFVSGLIPFILDGLANDEPVLVAVDASKIDLLRRELDGAADRVGFMDMRSLGRNPALIIPAWQEFLSGCPGDTGLRGVGEPVWPGRTGPELVESQYHESLLNLAFGDAHGFRLLCPYDAGRLEPSVLAVAECSHTNSDRYCGLDGIAATFSAPLPDPPPDALLFSLSGFSLSGNRLADLRKIVLEQATGAGVGHARTAELVLAVNEVVTNSLRHGRGRGTLSVWREQDRVIYEVCDSGRITSPLAGRRRPSLDGEGGRGLWLANQVCDLVQIRSSSAGSAVRLHMRL